MMYSKCSFIFFALFLCLVPVNGQEGHPSWWWGAKDIDFIVEGVITYDSTKYYEISPVGVEDRQGKYYCIVGKIKIYKVLFINKNSQYVESYQQYLKDMTKEYPVMITAMRRSSIHGTAFFQPTLGLDIPKESTIFNLSQVYLFPFGDLKLESVVPRENMDEAKGLVDKRPNNLLVN